MADSGTINPEPMVSPMLARIDHNRVFDDLDSLANTAAIDCLRLANDMITERGRFHIALSGGRTPQRLYEQLADRIKETDWSRWHIYFGDERCVPPDHPRSNAGMARKAWLSRVPIPSSQVHIMFNAGNDPENAAAAYAAHLQSLPRTADGCWPIFDLALMGLGSDGHVASLFPHSDALREDRRPVVAVHPPEGEEWRITLTYPVFNHARNLWFLVAGSDKREVMARIQRGENLSTPLPIQRLTPQAQPRWYLDRTAVIPS
ncbi:6-phosphogluconolactonase [Ectothiorhodospira variabilis]|uniref:6-phosphogluconolactonase n=1 Tax=Ectothiorhodospira variabilis TaxID=505694 RepID=UPI001EFB1DA5|nr:6-phosphogluconolactonase [Ectothiorhodospira variabilis]MCG5495485.1 6-phosphogluconolactonase [Ectothiorhodospira variabilis]MCG5503906.1 6-phosphogluconolactonase [Ectothiorhodospira variabilis]MCG5506963.1 6-phosphogluconolactonase [Ectothiorhodospira variabilis]